jgi:hypothetical protein
MTYTLAQAATAAGRNRSSVLRAIKSGKISAVRDEATAEWRIEPAELHRLYPVADAQGDAQRNAQLRNGDAQGELRARLDAAQEAICFRDEVIADLRQQRDRVQDQLTAALRLTDQRAGPAPGASVGPLSPWRRFLTWRK